MIYVTRDANCTDPKNGLLIDPVNGKKGYMKGGKVTGDF